MNRTDGFDHLVSDWLHADAEHRVPEHLDAVLRRTRSERQRPAWSSLERWLPVQTTLRFAPAPRVAWLLVVLGLALALAAVALVAGSRRQPAPPFGVARNGSVAYGAADGDIYTVDPTTGKSTAIITGPTRDETPDFSRDGSMLLFARASDSAGKWILMAADANGTNQRALTGPIDPTWNEWSPDGTQVAVIDAAAASPVLLIVDVTSPGAVRALDLGLVEPAGWVDWRPSESGELILRGRPEPGSSEMGMYAVRSDGTHLRPILPVVPNDAAYNDPRISPDGSLLTFWNWENLAGSDSPDGWTHVVDLQSGVDTQMHYDRFAAEVHAVFSPDARRMLVERQSIVATGSSPSQLIIAAVDGSGVVLPIGPVFPYDQPHTFGFSPDGQQVILTFDGATTQFFRASDGAELTGPLAVPAYPGWQRLAP